MIRDFTIRFPSPFLFTVTEFFKLYTNLVVGHSSNLGRDLRTSRPGLTLGVVYHIIYLRNWR